MKRIEFVRYMPCPNCQRQDEIELSFEVLDPDVVIYILDSVTDNWNNFPDRNRWNKIMNKIKRKYQEREWFPGFFRLFENLYYCPDCNILQKRIDWSLCCTEGEYWSRKPKCECGTILQEIKTPHELNNLIVRCPNCCTPLHTIIITEEFDYFEEKETICYPRQGN